METFDVGAPVLEHLDRPGGQRGEVRSIRRGAHSALRLLAPIAAAEFNAPLPGSAVEPDLVMPETPTSISATVYRPGTYGEGVLSDEVLASLKEGGARRLVFAIGGTTADLPPFVAVVGTNLYGQRVRDIVSFSSGPLTAPTTTAGSIDFADDGSFPTVGTTNFGVKKDGAAAVIVTLASQTSFATLKAGIEAQLSGITVTRAGGTTGGLVFTSNTIGAAGTLEFTDGTGGRVALGLPTGVFTGTDGLSTSYSTNNFYTNVTRVTVPAAASEDATLAIGLSAKTAFPKLARARALNCIIFAQTKDGVATAGTIVVSEQNGTAPPATVYIPAAPFDGTGEYLVLYEFDPDA